MGTLIHVKSIYTAAFKNCKSEFLVLILKAYSIFCAIMLLIVLYAFVFRALSGYRF